EASLDNLNYHLTNINKSYTIIPLEVVVNWSEADNFVYNGISQKDKVNAYIMGAALEGEIPVTISVDDFTNVGTYEFEASLDNLNYHLTNINKSYTIVKAPLSVIIHEKSSIYFDEITNFTYQIDGTVYQNDDLGIVLSSSVEKGSEVGLYDIVGTFDNDNYELTFIKGTYSILQAEQTLTPLVIDDLSITFHSITVRLIEGVVYSIDGVNYDTNYLFDELIPLTEYTIYAKLSETRNYHESLPVSIKVTTLADTREFDSIVNGLEDIKIYKSFTMIKRAFAILDEIGAEHFDQELIVDLEAYALSYNQYVDNLTNEIATITEMGNQITKPFDIIVVVTGLLNVLFGFLTIMFVKRGRKE
ncbi:MAG TPA: MBG domain-containing protein, partial [Bacilli bacterium]|nr:MBG domain-containing protein [Bacilli bacterium]